MKQDFPGQRESEELLFIFRRHGIVMAKGVLALIVLTAMAFVPLVIVPSNTNLIYIGLGGLVLGLLVFFYHWIGWHFSFYLVTNERIRQNRQRGLFNRSIIELNLDKIENVAVNTSGPLGSLFGYGIIIIRTQAGDMVIDKVSRAEEIYDKLQIAINKVNGKEDNDKVEPENT